MKTVSLFVIVLLSLSSFTKAQTGTIKGVLVDKNNAPLSFSNVGVFHTSDSSLLTGGVSTASGSFSIQVDHGEYYLRISAVGFTTYFSKALKVTEANPILDLSKFTLQKDVKMMDAVEVRVLRPQITVEADKMVVSVEGSAMAAGTSAYEVLEKSPGVFIDQDGNIQLNGRQGVQVMIDGRRSFLSAADLQNMLQGMAADNIKEVEIINNPSAKYDAEGNGGIINITLKKNSMQGVNGNVALGYRYNQAHNYNTGLQLNYKKGDWNSFLNTDFANRGRIRDAELYREINQTDGDQTIFDQIAEEKVLRKAPSMRIGTDYEINERQSVGAMVNLFAQEREGLFIVNSDLNQGDIAQYVESKNSSYNGFINARANLHYLYKLDTSGATLSMDFNVVKLLNSGKSIFTNSYFTVPELVLLNRERLENENPYHYDIYSAQIDFEGKFLGQKVESGFKGSQVVSDNNLKFYQLVEGELAKDQNRSNHFLYKEQIFAGYASFSGRLGKAITYKAGLRAEQTFSLGESLTLNNETERIYFNLFPSAFLQHTINENYQINYNYSRRIDRPNYDNLNPFIFYLDPYTWAQGNPFLRPQFTDALSVTQTFRGQFNLILSYGLTKDFVAEIPLQNPEDGTTVFKQSNLDEQQNYSATAVIPFQPTKWWSANGNFTVSYQDFSTQLFNNRLNNAATTAVVRLANTFMLPNELRIEMNTDYRSSTVWGVYEIAAQWGMDFAVKKSFLERKLELAFNFNDVFRSRKFQGTASFNGNVNEISQYFGQQSIGVSLRYMFSKGEEFKRLQRSNDLEELNRVGG